MKKSTDPVAISACLLSTFVIRLIVYQDSLDKTGAQTS